MDLQTAAQQVFNCIWCKITTLCLHHNAKVCPGNALLNSSPVKAGTPTSKHVNTPLWHAWKQQPCPSQNKAFCSVDKSLLCLNQAEGQQKDLTDNALTRDHKTWTSKACRPACNPCPSYRRKCTHNTIQKKRATVYLALWEDTTYHTKRPTSLVLKEAKDLKIRLCYLCS